MASEVKRSVRTEGGAVIVEFHLVSKDATDDTLVRFFGDIHINPTGDFEDNDPSYGKFYVDAGDPIHFFKEGEVRAVFQDDALSMQVLQRRATAWGNEIEARIKREMTRLRSLGTAYPTPATSVTFTI